MTMLADGVSLRDSEALLGFISGCFARSLRLSFVITAIGRLMNVELGETVGQRNLIRFTAFTLLSEAAGWWTVGGIEAQGVSSGNRDINESSSSH